MKRFIVLFLALGLVLALSACGYSQSDLDYYYDLGYSRGYDDGYSEGRDHGFSAGESFYYSEDNSYEFAEILDRLNKVQSRMDDPYCTVDDVYDDLDRVIQYVRDLCY